MCVVSMVGDYWRDRTLPQKYPNYTDWTSITQKEFVNAVTREEFDAALKRGVEELKQLLKAAVKYDEQVGEPHCENEDKVALIKKIAELVGVDIIAELVGVDIKDVFE